VHTFCLLQDWSFERGEVEERISHVLLIPIREIGWLTPCLVIHSSLSHDISLTNKNKKVPISKVLRAKNESRWVDPVIPRNATIRDAIPTCIDGGLSGMMVIESTSDKRVVGLITSRDLLREMSRGFKASLDPETIMNKTMSEFMTPVDQVVYARPHETIGMCRAIMATRNIKCIPVLSKDGKQVKGLVTARDMTQFATKAEDRGGKKSYLRNYSERIMTSNTSMADPPAYIHAHLAMEQKPLYANVGVAEYPHPFKTTPDDMESGMHHHRGKPKSCRIISCLRKAS